VIVRAFQEAQVRSRLEVGTGHLLLGTVRDEGTVGDLFASLGVGLDEARAAVEAEAARRGDPWAEAGPPRRPVLSTRAIRALATAGERAQRRQAPWVAPRDIVASIAADESSSAGRVLTALGVDVTALLDRLPETEA
jgi:ATP-dependent Clp protease ATP-binding subunit ClpA